MDIPPEATKMLNQIEEKKTLLLKIEKGRKKVTKHMKSQEKFKKKELRYKKHIDTTMKPLAEALVQNPEIGTPMLDLGSIDVSTLCKALSSMNKSIENKTHQSPNSSIGVPISVFCNNALTKGFSVVSICFLYLNSFF
jgi:hypothetical protein